MARKQLLTRRQVADELDVFHQTIVKWEQAGCPVAKRGRRGVASLYDLAKVRAWHKAREAVNHDGPIDLARERARKERAQALLAEQTYASRARELLPADEVERVWSEHIAAVRTKLLSWPATLSDRVARAATRGGVAGVESLLEQAVRDVLTELASGDPDDLPRPAKRVAKRKRKATRRKAAPKKKARKRAASR